MNDNLKELLASNLEKPLVELCVLSEYEEVYKGLIKYSFPHSDIKKNIDSPECSIRSNYLSIGSPNYCSFRFLIYPDGKKETLKGSVSISIEFYNKLPESARVEGEISIFGEEPKKFCIGGCTSIIDIDVFYETRRLKKIISYSDDDLEIQCSIKMKLKEVKCNFDGSTIEYAESREFNTYKDSLLKHKLFSDVTFHLCGGVEKAHRAVLAKVPFFKELFDNFDKQNIELTHIKHKTFVHVLEFLYKNDIPLLDFQLACELYIVSNDLKIFDLKNICSSYFGANLTEENVFIVISLAHKYHDILLKKTCIKFIKGSDIEKLVSKSIIL